MLGATAALLVACRVDEMCQSPCDSIGHAVDRDVLDGGPNAPPINPCVNTPTEPKCLDESTALFVSAAASEAGADGTRVQPFKTVGAALSAVTAARKRLYVCEGTYAENVKVQAAVSLLGGLACDWNAKAAKPRIAPAKASRSPSRRAAASSARTSTSKPMRPFFGSVIRSNRIERFEIARRVLALAP